jgi:hypothetical protein
MQEEDGHNKKIDMAEHLKGIQPRRLTLQLTTRRTGMPFI